MLTLASGQPAVVRLGDRLRLTNGLRGQAHSWGHRGVIVYVDYLERLAADGLSIAAYDCGDRDIAEVLY